MDKLRRGKATVVVVGAGINGAAAAFYLAQRGITDVIVLDRAFPGAGASSRGMGLLRQYHANEPEAALAIRSLAVFRHWDSLVGGTCGFVQSGFLWLDNASVAGEVRANVSMVNRLGGRARVIDSQELRALQPHLVCDDTLASWEPDAGYAYGALATDALHAGARRAGVTLLTRTPALALETRNGRISGVATPQGTIATETVVLAAGACPFLELDAFSARRFDGWDTRAQPSTQVSVTDLI